LRAAAARPPCLWLCRAVGRPAVMKCRRRRLWKAQRGRPSSKSMPGITRREPQSGVRPQSPCLGWRHALRPVAVPRFRPRSGMASEVAAAGPCLWCLAKATDAETRGARPATWQCLSIDEQSTHISSALVRGVPRCGRCPRASTSLN
jgi:hypothetical protein